MVSNPSPPHKWLLQQQTQGVPNNGIPVTINIGKEELLSFVVILFITFTGPGRVMELQRESDGKTTDLKQKFIDKASKLGVI